MLPSVSSEYVTTVDQTDRVRWDELLTLFSDASLYQTWSHGVLRRGERSLSHLVLSRDGVPVAAAQVVIVKIPAIARGIAYVKSGPLWRSSGSEPDFDIYARALRALRAEYAERRGLILRVKPWEIDREGRLSTIREATGFKRIPNVEPYRTFVLDLAHDLDEIRDGMARKWRRDLRRAHERGLEAVAAPGLAGIDDFVELYKAMHSRKRFADFETIDRLRGLFSDLPEPMKPRVTLCRYQGEVLSGVVCSSMGDTALALFGANSEKGLSMGASYVVNWQVIQQLKEEAACRWYDLVGGMDNPGIRHFKAGMAKGCGMEVHMADCAVGDNLVSRVSVGLGDWLRSKYRTARRRLGT